MRMTVFQSSGVYPEPVRAFRAWQLLHWASTIALPFPSGVSFCAQAGSAEHRIGAEVVAKSPPDGYTWFVSPDNVFSINPHLGKQPFDAFAELAPVTLLARTQFLLVVHPSVPANSVQELIAYAKSHPGQLNYGS